MNIYGFNFIDTINALIGAMAVGLSSGLILFLIRFIIFHWIERKEV
jgi:hypothetical protein